jgi:magnesium-transporting ATPase (P-type)
VVIHPFLPLQWWHRFSSFWHSQPPKRRSKISTDSEQTKAPIHLQLLLVTISDTVRDGVKLVIDSMNVCPGDIIYAEKGAKFPVDVILISSSYEEGTVFIETAELDG